MEIRYTGTVKPWGGDPESRWQPTPCQQQQMPFAIAAGVGAGAALAAGTVAAGVATVAAVAAVVAGTLVAVGLVMTVVGLATGDTKLAKIGGYIGLAGGVAGIGAGLASSSAATAASAATDQVASQAATQSIAPAATKAITPALTSQTITPVAAQAIEPGSLSAASSLTSGVTQGATPALSGSTTLTGQEVAQGINQIGVNQGANLGTVGTSIAPTQAANQSSFFGFLESPGFKTALEVGKIGAGFIQGSYTSDVNDKYLDLKGQELNLTAANNASNQAFQNRQIALQEQQQQYEQDIKNQQIANANAPAKGILSTTMPTAEQRLQASRERAAQAAANAKIITGGA